MDIALKGELQAHVLDFQERLSIETSEGSGTKVSVCAERNGRALTVQDRGVSGITCDGGFAID